jgi:hypothetical protein
MLITFEPGRPPLAGGWDLDPPPLAPVRQKFPAGEVGSIEQAVAATLAAMALPDLAGKEIAITVGSRGISRLAEIVANLVAVLRARGAQPFIVPAMGSHGGGTAEGQRALIEGYGVTEASVGAPIRSSMEAVPTGQLRDGSPLFCDRNAFAADGIVLLNTIRPHSAFKAEIESGLMKMAVIGLGKHRGAAAFHERGWAGFPDRLLEGGRKQIATLPILFGLAVVENAYGAVARLEAVPTLAIEAREKVLLAETKRLMGRLLVPRIDVLIVDQIGKNIAGAGMDPNVTGRSAVGIGRFTAPPIDKIIVRGLSEATHGNAAGIGAADFTTARCLAAIDFSATYANVLSAGVMFGARIPVVLPNDRDAIAAALRTCGVARIEDARVVRIRDTKSLDEIAVSPACIPDLVGSDGFEILGSAQALRFDPLGNIV